MFSRLALILIKVFVYFGGEDGYGVVNVDLVLEANEAMTDVSKKKERRNNFTRCKVIVDTTGENISWGDFFGGVVKEVFFWYKVGSSF